MRLFLKALKYFFLAILLLIIVFLIYNYFRVSSEDIVKHIETDIKEGMPANEMQAFLNKYDFICEKDETLRNRCTLDSTSVYLLGVCEHRIAFNITNHIISDLYKNNLCASL